MKENKTNYSDIMKSIKETKEDLWTEDNDVEFLDKKHHKYITNKGLVTYKNILLLNAVNSLPHLDKKMHYHYLLHSIPPNQEYKSVSKRRTKLQKIEEKLEVLYDKLKKGGKQ